LLVRVRPIRGRPWVMLSAAFVLVAAVVVIWFGSAFPVAVAALALSVVCNFLDRRTPTRGASDFRAEDSSK
jgi:hypothetical protein